MANTPGEKELRRDWPNVSGLTAETTKQEGRQQNLTPAQGSHFPRRKKVGLGYPNV